MKNIKRITAFYFILILLIIAFANQGDHMYYLNYFVHKIPYGDKWGHFILMGLLAFLVNLIFKCKKWQFFKLSFFKGSLIVFIIVTLEEFSQIFIENRTFDWLDLMFDYLGIFVFGQLAGYFSTNKNQSD